MRAGTPLLYLQLTQLKNRLRTAFRSPGLWSFLIAFVAVYTWMTYGADGGQAAAEEGPMRGFRFLLVTHGDIAIALFSVAALLWGLWRGARKPPLTIQEADAALLLLAPISPRKLLARSLVLDSLQRLWLIIPLTAAFFAVRPEGVAVDTVFPIWMYVAVLGASLVGRSLHFAVWTHLEAMEGREAAKGRTRRLRGGLRVAALTAAIGLLLWLVTPVFPELLATTVPEGGVPVWTPVLERADVLTELPPFTWVKALGRSGELPISEPLLGGLLPLLLAAAALQAIAVRGATDYYEPLVHQAEQMGNLFRRSASDNIDVQGVALEAYRTEVRRALPVPGFGWGPWVLVWSGFTRWLRFGMATARFSLLTYAVLGIALGAAIRWWDLPSHWGWIGPAILAALSGGAGYLPEELGRPYIHLFPGAAWKKLLAAGAVGTLDALLNGGALLIVVALLAPLTIEQATASIVLVTAVTLVSQAAGALGQIVLPSWLGGTVRPLLLLGVTLVAVAPGFTLLLVRIAAGAGTGAAVPAAALLVALAVVFFAIAAPLFRRAEMP